MKLSEAMKICPPFKLGSDGRCVHRLPDGRMCDLPSRFDCELLRRQSLPPVQTSISKVQKWEECPRAWALRYFYKVTPPVEPSWAAVGKAFAFARAKIDAGLPYDLPDEVKGVDRLRLEVVLDKYKEVDWRIRGQSEVQLTYTLDPGVEKSGLGPLVALGYADVISEDRKRIGEWKYTVDPDSYDILKVYLQGGSYLAAVPEAEEVVLCLAKKPRLEPFKATPPEKRKMKKDGTPYAGVVLNDETPEEFKKRLTENLGTTAFTFKTFLRREFDLKGIANHLLARYHEYQEASRTMSFFPKYSSCSMCEEWRDYCKAHPLGIGCTEEGCSHPAVCMKVRAIENIKREEAR